MWTCPACERTLINANQWHNCVKVSVTSLFVNKNPLLIPVFEQLHASVKTWKNVSASATKNCIVYIGKKTFLVVRPLKNQLDLKFYLPEYTDEFPIYKCIPWSGKFETHIRLTDAGDLDQTVLRMIKISFEL